MSQKIVGKGRSGDFVHKGQTMAAEQGFRNVSKLWFDKCKPLEDVRREQDLQENTIEDKKLPLRAVVPTVANLGDGDCFCFNVDGDLYKPTKHSKSEASGVFNGYRTEAASGDSKGNLFGVINGITRAAQLLEAGRWVELDSIAGILTRAGRKDWDSLTGRAAKLNLEAVESSYLTAV